MTQPSPNEVTQFLKANLDGSVIGQQIDRYRIVSLLGAGGMGEVYLAEDASLGRQVALKLLPAHLTTDKSRLHRFKQEARAASALNHPNILTIHEIGEANGHHFIATEFVEGETLRQRMIRAPIGLNEARDTVIQVASALAAAHAKGIVHRDIKPENIMLRRDGYAKVLDFGLAKLTARRGVNSDASTWANTEPGVVVGTVQYMSPEQLLGQPADAGTDVWAIGVVLYEMVAGAHPFRGRTHFELSSAILRESPMPLPSNVPDGVVGVIERCLEKELSRRYRDASEVRTALEATRMGFVPDSIVSRSFSRRRRLAVLPLLNLSGDPEQEYFVDGTHEALITDLAGISALRVIARSSVIRYKIKEAPLPQIAEELKVDLVLTGSVIRLGECVRITAQLIDVSTEEHVWAGRYDRAVSDVLSLQNEIVVAIARAIELQLTPQEQELLARGRPVNAEAYEAYLKGRFHWYKISREHYDTALEYFQRALEKDPNYALAYAGIANTWLMRGDAGFVPAIEVGPKLKAAVSKAMELNDTLAEVHDTSGNFKFLYEWDWNGAEREYQKAIQLNPNYADAHFSYSDLLISTKRTEEAKAEMERALELDPLSSFFHCFQGWHLVYLRQYDDAIARLHKVLRAEPNFSSAYLGLWGAFYQKRMFGEALEAAQKFYAALDDNEVVQCLVNGYDDGYSEAMRQSAVKLAERASRTYTPAIRIARLYAHASEKDRAIEWLEKAYEKRETTLIHLGVSWDWDSLRDDPRFQDLLRRMNLSS